MQIGVVGLGRMGANIARRLIRHGHECVVFNRSLDKVQQLSNEGAIGANSLTELVRLLTKPRVIWVMLPAGEVTEQVIAILAELIGLGDIIVDGGNSYYKDDIHRTRMLNTRGMHYVDVGISGNVSGLEQGYCLMIGGDAEIVRYIEPILSSLALGISEMGSGDLSSTTEMGYLHCGPSGAGHFVKMVHNSVKSALMQAYAEGFAIFHQANAEVLAPEYRYTFNVAEIAQVWCRGSVVNSCLLEHCIVALSESTANQTVSMHAEQGSWTVMAAIEEAVPVNVLSAALYTQLQLQHSHSFVEQMLAAMDSQCHA